uniref:Uncharacterized protein n=1 Tax=Salix viminalis TaxID=40686 RepID=A0A6N2KBG9_SALVM
MKSEPQKRNALAVGNQIQIGHSFSFHKEGKEKSRLSLSLSLFLSVLLWICLFIWRPEISLFICINCFCIQEREVPFFVNLFSDRGRGW